MNHFSNHYFYQEVVSTHSTQRMTTRSCGWTLNDPHQASQPLRNVGSHLPSNQYNEPAVQNDSHQSRYPPQLQPIRYEFSQPVMHASHCQAQQPQSSEWLIQQPWPTVHQQDMDFQPVTSAPDGPHLPQYHINETGEQSIPDSQPPDVDWTQAPAQSMDPVEQPQEMDSQPPEAATSADMIPLTSFQQQCALANQRARASWTTKKEDWSDTELLEYFHDADTNHPKKNKKRRRLRPQLPTPEVLE